MYPRKHMATEVTFLFTITLFRIQLCICSYTMLCERIDMEIIRTIREEGKRVNEKQAKGLCLRLINKQDYTIL